jgi:hypothetical protein
MKRIFLLLTFLSVVNYGYCHNTFVEIESTKTIGLLSFLDANTESPRIPGSLGV